jgi:Transposase DDE domain
LFNVNIEQARQAGLLECSGHDETDKTRLGCIDSTGMEARHVSYYFTRRSGRKQRKFPKFWAVVHAASHVCLGMVPGVGPSPDDLQFHRVAAEAHARQRFDALAGDCGFDGEHHQRFLHEELGVLGIIPPLRGRPRNDGKGPKTGFFRSMIYRMWPKGLYGQRWQVETFFSMVKRLLDSFLRAASWPAQHREMCLRVLTLNFMIIAAN